MALMGSYLLENDAEILCRAERLPRDTQQAMVLVALVAVSMLGFAGADPHSLEDSAALASFLALRALLCARTPRRVLRGQRDPG